jgi:hypothetical protein
VEPHKQGAKSGEKLKDDRDINNIVNRANCESKEQSPYFSTCGCLDNAVSSKDYIAQNGGISEYRIAHKWPNLRHYTKICLWENTKTSVSISRPMVRHEPVTFWILVRS